MFQQRSILIITPCFHPGVGGTETYVNELCEYPRTHNCYVHVPTYQPLADSKTKGEKLEKLENVKVQGFWWTGYNLFHKLEEYPFLLFLYITPYLLIK